MSRSLQTIFPFLRYQDAAAAIAWLIEAFGCEKHAVHEGPDGTIAHAELRLGGDVFMLGTATDDFLGMKTPRQLGGTVTAGIYVVVEDPDAHCARARAAGAEVLMEPRGMEYGSREYAARDLEGNLWSFGTYRPAD
ncbi:MAG: VOC family protein [Thermoanaerobaculia bacterium]